MDIQTLSQQLLTFLAPFLPYLLKMGEQAAEEAGKKLGAEAWEGAKALWAKLKPKVEAKPAAREAAQEVAAHPADEDAQTALQWQLEKFLAEDEALADEVRQTLQSQPARQVIARGARSIAIGAGKRLEEALKPFWESQPLGVVVLAVLLLAILGALLTRAVERWKK